MKARDLGLIEPALSAAIALEQQFPEIVFTSGRRSREDQARAMAQNIAIAGSGWLRRTYKDTPIRRAISARLNVKPKMAEASQIQAAILEELNHYSDIALMGLSKHIGGLAFDLRPMVDSKGRPTRAGEAVIAAIAGLPGLQTFLDHEGGLVRWHLQFYKTG